MKKLISLLIIIGGYLSLHAFITFPVLGTFNDIVSPNPADYSSYQIKITYTSIQSKTTPTLLVVGSGRLPDVSEFIPYRTADVHYGNDDVKVAIISVSGTTIKKFVDAVALRSQLTTPGSSNDPIYSLMIERNLPPGEIVFQHLADDFDATIILNLLEGATTAEPADTKTTIRRFRNFTVGPH